MILVLVDNSAQKLVIMIAAATQHPTNNVKLLNLSSTEAHFWIFKMPKIVKLISYCTNVV